MIVLPLILGNGIDAGVHVVHDYVAQTGPYRISGSTASAVVINTVTNIAGFGTLMLASHQGLQSLGRVLTLGLSACLFTSLLMLPALLTLLSGRRAGTLDLRDDDAEAAGDVPAEIVPVYRVDETTPLAGERALSQETAALQDSESSHQAAQHRRAA